MVNINQYRETIFAISLSKGRQEIEFSQWGAGEYKIDYNIKNKYGNNIVVYVPYLSFKTLEKLLVFNAFCEKQEVKIMNCVVGYISYGRQERETGDEPKLLSIMLKQLDNLANTSVIEPHNQGSVNTHFDSIHWASKSFYKGMPNKKIVAPDKGARDRFFELGIPCGIVIDKQRVNGEVKSTIAFDLVRESIGDPQDYDGTFAIIDDICDGGRTFVNVAELLKATYPKARVELYVAHAILPFGVESLKGKIDKIVATDTCYPQGTYYDGFLEVRDVVEMIF